MRKISLLSLLFILGVASGGRITPKEECLPIQDRIDCHPDQFDPETGAQEQCEARNCIWCPDGSDGAPACILRSDYGYVVDSEPTVTPNGFAITLRRNPSPSHYFGGDAELITAFFDYQSDNRLRIRITDGDDSRFEVPVKIDPPASGPGSEETRLYEVEIVREPLFAIKVIRKSTGTVVFDTSLGGLTFSDYLHQITIRIPEGSSAYGIGENEQTSLKHDFSKFQVFPLWARDQGPSGNMNLYGVHPIYQVIEDAEGNSHTVMFFNANAQEFVLSPKPAYIYRTIGGIIDMFIFMGPTPEDANRQLSEAIGRQQIPPYWALGFQLSRWGYDTIENLKAAVDRTALANIPHDVQYLDIDGMERELDFTVDNENFTGMREYVNELKGRGIKFIPILDTFIDHDEPDYPPLQLGNMMDVWIKNSDGTTNHEGHVWPGTVYFPDYFKESTKKWWIDEIVKFKDLLNFDGIWIDMNEPANWPFEGENEIICEVNPINNPPYVPNIGEFRQLKEKTICPDTKHAIGNHFDLHSLYGLSSVIPTLEGMRKALGDKRGIVVTRSTFIGSGRYTGHWLGDNYSKWSNLHHSIIGMIQFNMFGMPYVGADICGFGEVATEEMCERWMELGSFYPYARNHNIRDTPDQDPGIWPDTVGVASRKALEIRYTLMPTFYSLFYRHRLNGDTVIRPLWNEFAKDMKARDVDRQFLWGSGILISPVLEEGAEAVSAYFPDARWFNYENGIELPTRANTVILETPMDKINVHIRGGGIYPTQEAALNTDLSRNNPFGLIIALDDSKQASGFLYYDDGDTVEPQDSGLYFEAEYTLENGELIGKVLQNNYSGIRDKKLSNIRMFGSPSIESMIVNGESHSEFTDGAEGEIIISNLDIPMNEELIIKFTFGPDIEPPTTTTEDETSETNSTTTMTEATTPEGGGGGGSRIASFSIMILLLPIIYWATDFLTF